MKKIGKKLPKIQFNLDISILLIFILGVIASFYFYLKGNAIEVYLPKNLLIQVDTLGTEEAVRFGAIFTLSNKGSSRYSEIVHEILFEYECGQEIYKQEWTDFIFVLPKKKFLNLRIENEARPLAVQGGQTVSKNIHFVPNSSIKNKAIWLGNYLDLKSFIDKQTSPIMKIKFKAMGEAEYSVSGCVFLGKHEKNQLATIGWHYTKIFPLNRCDFLKDN